MNRRTTLMRVYRDDLEQVRFKFPGVKSADFFRVVVKTNPIIQLEAALRKNVKK